VPPDDPAESVRALVHFLWGEHRAGIPYRRDPHKRRWSELARAVEDLLRVRPPGWRPPL
jgi:hypothetical protein